MDKTIIWMETTREKQWRANTPEQIQGGVENLKVTHSTERIIDGFGSCFNELGLKAIDNLSESERNQVLDALFNVDGHCRFTLCRIPIGASDYALEWYSHNETDGDYEMKDFSIQRDQRYLIPYIKEALKRNPNIQFLASPWSPPTWMKYPKAYNFGTLRWENKVLKAYALYLVKFIQAYEKEGIIINQIHIQNEVVADQKFPSCKWTGEKLQVFIRDYLGPTLEAHGLKTEIWLGTINAPEPFNELAENELGDFDSYAGLVLSDPEAYKYITGVGYQWAGKYVIQNTVRSYPELKYLQTENECGNGKNTWEYAHYVYKLFHHYFINGVNGYLYWNAVLELEGESTWGWKQNSMITVNPKMKNFTFNPEFYVMKHFSHYVQKGAVRLETDGPFSGNAVVFKNPDDSIVIIIANPLNKLRSLQISINHKTYAFELKGSSFNTIVVK